MRSSRAWSLAKAPSTQPLDAGTPGGDQCDPEIGALLGTPDKMLQGSVAS
jgi:hypothetical protein